MYLDARLCSPSVIESSVDGREIWRGGLHIREKKVHYTDLKPLRLNMCNKTKIHEVKCEVYNCRIAEILF